MITIRIHNINRLSPRDLGALRAIAHCYGAHLHRATQAAMQVVLLGDLFESFLMTVQRDVLPIEISKSI